MVSMLAAARPLRLQIQKQERKGTTEKEKRSVTLLKMAYRAVTAIVFASLIIALLSLVQTSDVHQSSAWTVISKLCWKNATVRPPLLLVLVIAGWGWVVSVCQHSRLEIEQVLLSHRGLYRPPRCLPLHRCPDSHPLLPWHKARASLLSRRLSWRSLWPSPRM